MAEFFIDESNNKTRYFIKDEFYNFANDKFLMKNKENGLKRPCFLAIKNSDNIIWMIPVTSKMNKFKIIYDKKISKYGYCNTIVIDKLLGRDCVFLIQNMFPITENFIEAEYIQKSNGIPVAISESISKEIISKFKKSLILVRKGYKGIVFPNVLSIEAKLLEFISNNK